jgi:hypothetical protein
MTIGAETHLRGGDHVQAKAMPNPTSRSPSNRPASISEPYRDYGKWRGRATTREVARWHAPESRKRRSMQLRTRC